MFYWGTFTTCYIEGLGLTAFKKVSEHIISAILSASMLLLYRNRAYFDRGVIKLLFFSIIATIGSELAFIFYVSVLGFSNFFGHILKILAFFLVYRALIETGLVKPYNLLFFDLKRNEASLRKAQEELDSRATQLDIANQELESFSYTVSHDLRSPLRAINGFSRILMEKHAPQLSEEVHYYLRLVNDNTKRMGELIDDLLDFSRLSRQPLNKENVDPVALVRQVMEELRIEQEGRKVEIIIGDSTAGSGEVLPDCQAAPRLLKLVFTNLLENALKFTRKREAAVIEVGYQMEGDARVRAVRLLAQPRL